MKYIQLNDDSYILHNDNGLTTLTRKTINFNKIKRLIDNGAEDQDIIPLLKTPELENGLFEAYLHEDTDTIIIKHISNDTSKWSALNNQHLVAVHDHERQFTFNHQEAIFLGVYVNITDVMTDFPEYCL